MNRKISFLLVVMLSMIAVSCGSKQPAVDIEATVNARVQATVSAGNDASSSQLPIASATSDSPSSTMTPIPPTPTPIPPTSAPTIDSSLPTGQWAVRAYKTDDRNIILVNGHIVGVSYCCDGETGWIDVGDLLVSELNYITFVNLNGGPPAKWGFSLRHNDEIVWGNEGDSDQPNTMSYIQTIQVFSDNTTKEVNLRDFNKDNLGGAWTARVKADDVGLLIINGVPAAGGYGDGFDWFDIGGFLYAGQDNIIQTVVWNSADNYSWDIAIRKGESVVWGSENNGSGQTGEVFYKTVTIDGGGNVIR